MGLNLAKSIKRKAVQDLETLKAAEKKLLAFIEKVKKLNEYDTEFPKGKIKSLHFENFKPHESVILTVKMSEKEMIKDLSKYYKFHVIEGQKKHIEFCSSPPHFIVYGQWQVTYSEKSSDKKDVFIPNHAISELDLKAGIKSFTLYNKPNDLKVTYDFGEFKFESTPLEQINEKNKLRIRFMFLNTPDDVQAFWSEEKENLECNIFQPLQTLSENSKGVFAWRNDKNEAQQFTGFQKDMCALMNFEYITGTRSSFPADMEALDMKLKSLNLAIQKAEHHYMMGIKKLDNVITKGKDVNTLCGDSKEVCPCTLRDR